MNKFIYLIAFALTTIVLSSCNDGKTYAEQLKDERKLIADYIKRNNIEVVESFPEAFPWPDNVYVKTQSGLYFRLENEGEIPEDSIGVEANDKVVPRFYQYTLNEKSDTIFNWNTIHYPFPTTFNYLDYTKVCVAWHEAVTYMKYNESEAKFIVHSKIGFESSLTSVTPYGYHMKIQIQK